MDDGLNAFVEAADGAVRVHVPPGPGADLEVMQAKACHLLGVWSARTPSQVVVVGDRPVPSRLLVSAAALEIAVHGWDVGRATGSAKDLPDDLAVALMPVAQAVIMPEDRPSRFAAPVLTAPDARASDVLLGYVGRRA
jgi:uncharacterized protein (TIGR03086 family)